MTKVVRDADFKDPVSVHLLHLSSTDEDRGVCLWLLSSEINIILVFADIMFSVCPELYLYSFSKNNRKQTEYQSLSISFVFTNCVNFSQLLTVTNKAVSTQTSIM